MSKAESVKMTATKSHLTITVQVKEGGAHRTSVLRVELSGLEDSEVNLIGQAIDEEIRRRLAAEWGARIQDSPLF